VYTIITHHAEGYTGGSSRSRTALKSFEIIDLIESNSYVRFGESQKTHFDLIWDHYKEIAVVLLTVSPQSPGKTVVTSIWGYNFHFPVSPPSADQIALAREKSKKFRSRIAP
jgi:hypothetical protein